MNHQNKTFLKFIIIVIVIIALGIGIILFNLPKFDKFLDKMVIEGIQDQFDEFLCEDFSDFKVYANGVDDGLYLFTFVCQEGYSSSEISTKIKQKRSDFNVIVDNDEMLALQKLDSEYHPDGFEEVRVRFRPNDFKVIVFVGYFDSENDLALYPTMLDKFSKLNRNYSRRSRAM